MTEQIIFVTGSP